METITLEVKSRDPKIKNAQLRAVSQIPAEYYGKGVSNKSLQMDYQTFRRIYKVAGKNTIITLKVDGNDEFNVLVHDIQLDPITDKVTHVDFFNVKMDEKIHTKVSLEFSGQAPAVKEFGGILMTNLTEVEIKCLPKDLIHKIEVSINSLVDFRSFVRVKDLVVPETITILNNPEDVVATVVAPKQEEEAPKPVEAVEGAVPAEGAATTTEEGKEAKTEEGGDK